MLALGLAALAGNSNMTGTGWLLAIAILAVCITLFIPRETKSR